MVFHMEKLEKVRKFPKLLAGYWMKHRSVTIISKLQPVTSTKRNDRSQSVISAVIVDCHHTKEPPYLPVHDTDWFKHLCLGHIRLESGKMMMSSLQKLKSSYDQIA